MEIPEQVNKMIEQRWCFTCNMHLQSCINAGKCLGDKGGELNGKQNSV